MIQVSLAFSQIYFYTKNIISNYPEGRRRLRLNIMTQKKQRNVASSF